MISLIVTIVAVALLVALITMPMTMNRDDTDKMNLKQRAAEEILAQSKSNRTSTPDKFVTPSVPEPEKVTVVIKEVTPQINNYNFESLSNVLLVVLSMIGGFFSCKYLFKFFNYLITTYKFKKNEKKTNKLIASLNETIDNQKEFLAIADRIEHQLKINDILLRSDESKKYGLNLEVADDYLHSSYTFINDKLIISLQ